MKFSSTYLHKNRILSLLILDSIGLIIAFFLSYFLRNLGPFRYFLDEVQPLRTYLWVLPLSIALLITTFYSYSLYSVITRKSPFKELLTSLKAQFTWILIIMSLSYLSKYDYSRIIVVLTFAFNILTNSILRYLYKKLELKNFKKGIGLTNVLIVGAGQPGRRLARRLKDFENAGFRLIGFIDDHARSRENYPIIGKLKSLHKIISKHNVKEVYVTDPRLSYEEIISITINQLGNRISFKVATDLFGLVSKRADHYEIEDIPTLNLWQKDKSIFYRMVKRSVDVFLSFILLIVTFPLWVVIAVFILLDDGLPVLLKLKRVGKNKKGFDMYKFRTMKKGTNQDTHAPRSKKDNRITEVGKHLRKTSLDELPQLLNILKGEMSLVGPRPEIPSIVKNYTSWQELRLSVKPGLTGLWQILGRKDLPLHENIEYDFYYINNQNLLMDLTILLKTIPSVLKGNGAY